MLVAYMPQCKRCLKSLPVGGRSQQKKYCDDCKKEKKRVSNLVYRKTFFEQKRLKPAYLTLKQIEFLKNTGINFSAFVRTKLDEEMKKHDD